MKLGSFLEVPVKSPASQMIKGDYTKSRHGGIKQYNDENSAAVLDIWCMESEKVWHEIPGTTMNLGVGVRLVRMDLTEFGAERTVLSDITE